MVLDVHVLALVAGGLHLRHRRAGHQDSIHNGKQGSSVAPPARYQASTASPWPGRWRNSNTPRGNLTCVSVFLVEPTGLHHAGDDLAFVFLVMPADPHHAGDDPSIIFIFLVVCTKPAATLIQDHRPPSARRRSRQAKTPKCNSATRPALHVQARHRPDTVTAKTPKCGPATRPARHVQARHQSDVATAVKMPKRGATTAALHIQAGAEDNGATVNAPR